MPNPSSLPKKKKCKKKIKWHEGLQLKPVNGFDIMRKGSTECDVRIFLFPKFRPLQFRYPEKLTSVLGVERDTKSNTILRLLSYCYVTLLQKKKKKYDPISDFNFYFLQDKKLFHPNNRKQIEFDSALSEIFGVKKCTVAELPSKLANVLQPEYYEVVYRIKYANLKSKLKNWHFF